MASNAVACGYRSRALACDVDAHEHRGFRGVSRASGAPLARGQLAATGAARYEALKVLAS